MATEQQRTRAPEELVVRYQVDGQEIKLTPAIVQEYIVGSGSQITLPEFKMFTELCKARGLNPFLREAYCLKYGDTPAFSRAAKLFGLTYLRCCGRISTNEGAASSLRTNPSW